MHGSKHSKVDKTYTRSVIHTGAQRTDNTVESPIPQTLLRIIRIRETTLDKEIACPGSFPDG